MQALAAIAVCALIGASIVVAVRLLMLHRRSGGWPELMLGGMLLLSVGVGYPAIIAAAQIGGGWSGPLAALGGLGTAGGFSLLFVFTWRVFRPQSAWAPVFVVAALLALLAGLVDVCIIALRDGHVELVKLSRAEALLQMLPVMAGYVWTAWESLRYYGAMRRRVEIGLGDPVVANRFLLWGLMGICATIGVGFNVGAALLQIDGLDSPGVLFGSGCIGMAQAVFLTLAFVPPRSYLGWVRARAAASTD